MSKRTPPGRSEKDGEASAEPTSVSDTALPWHCLPRHPEYQALLPKEKRGVPAGAPSPADRPGPRAPAATPPSTHLACPPRLSSAGSASSPGRWRTAWPAARRLPPLARTNRAGSEGAGSAGGQEAAPPPGSRGRPVTPPAPHTHGGSRGSPRPPPSLVALTAHAGLRKPSCPAETMVHAASRPSRSR